MANFNKKKTNKNASKLQKCFRAEVEFKPLPKL